MINIKEEIQILLLKKGLSMRKISQILRDKGLDVPKASGLSYRFNKKRVRFETVAQIVDYLGYEIKIVEKLKNPAMQALNYSSFNDNTAINAS